jgi:hypothetical protein
MNVRGVHGRLAVDRHLRYRVSAQVKSYAGKTRRLNRSSRVRIESSLG